MNDSPPLVRPLPAPFHNGIQMIQNKLLCFFIIDHYRIGAAQTLPVRKRKAIFDPVKGRLALYFTGLIRNRLEKPQFDDSVLNGLIIDFDHSIFLDQIVDPLGNDTDRNRCFRIIK